MKPECRAITMLTGPLIPHTRKSEAHRFNSKIFLRARCRSNAHAIKAFPKSPTARTSTYSVVSEMIAPDRCQGGEVKGEGEGDDGAEGDGDSDGEGCGVTDKEKNVIVEAFQSPSVIQSCRRKKIIIIENFIVLS